jgi:hypothetical protein
MIGNGQSSRFTIRKGALQCYVELTLAGHQIYILKEDGTVCKEDSGVWIDEKFL